MSYSNVIAARESALARCRRDGGPLYTVKATGIEGAVFESDTLPPHDAEHLKLTLELNAADGAWKVDGEAVESIELVRFR